jgi:hypothetical protein
MSDKGFLASVCGFFKSLFSSSPSPAPTSSAKPSSPAAKSNDGLTGVERYIRNQSNSGSQLTGVEKYIRNKTTTTTVVTSVEQYIRNKAQAKPMTGVERYIQSKG